MRKFNRERDRTHYMDLPRRKRRNAYVSLRWRIRGDPNGGPVFTSDHMLQGGTYDGEVYTGSPDSQWNDFNFVSHLYELDGVVYTGTVRTIQMAMLDMAEDYAWTGARNILTPEEYELAHPPLGFKRGPRGFSTLIIPPTAVFDRLGGLSEWGVRAKIIREYLDLVEPVAPSCTLDRTYSSGIGAIFVVDEPRLDIGALSRLVNDFWARGEVSYGDDPVSPSRPDVKKWLEAAVDQTALGWERMDERARAAR